MDLDRRSRSELEIMLDELCFFDAADQARDYIGLIDAELQRRDASQHASASFERMRQEVAAVEDGHPTHWQL